MKLAYLYKVLASRRTVVLTCVTAVFFLCSPPATAQTLDALRDEFKLQENAIVEKYDQLARQPGADKKSLTAEMAAELKRNRQDYSALAGKDPRYSRSEVKKAFEAGKIPEIGAGKAGHGYLDQINAELAKKGLKLQSTGGSPDLTPSHINADIDAVVVRKDGSPATAKQQLQGIEIIKKHGASPGEVLRENAARFDHHGKDMTVWKPETPEGQKAKLTDHDAFKTEGGKHVTRNPGAVQDAHGELLDNRAKFESARTTGDLKTQGKSMLKAGTGEASGVKVIVQDEDGAGKVVRKSEFQKRSPELYEKAKKLKEYGTTHEAGITEVGDSPEVKQRKIAEFQQEMNAEMDTLQKEAERKGKIRDKVRENFQESYEKTGAEPDAKRAAEIKDERGRVVKSNQEALKAISEDQAKPTAKETFTAGRKGPGDSGGAAARTHHVDDVPAITRERGPSAQNTNPGGQLEALGIKDNRPTLTPEQAGVKMPGRLDAGEELGRKKWVGGDPELAKLAQPKGQEIGSLPKDQELGKLAKGEAEIIDRGRQKTGSAKAPSPAELKAEMAAQAAREAGEAAPERLVSEKTLAERRAAMAGEKTSSLLEGGKSSSAHIPEEGGLKAKGLAALEGANKLDAAAMAKISVSELPATAGAARRGLNVGAEKMMHGLAFLGAAAEGGTLGYGAGKAIANLKDAYYAEDKELKEILIERAKESAQETGEHAAASAGIMAGLALAPQTGGAALAGYGSYQATRAVLEGTETGQAVEKTVQDGMTGGLTLFENLRRRILGEKTIEEQEREAVSQQQEGWKRALDSDKIQLQEGATEDDLRVLVERMVQEGKSANLDDLGDLKNVIELSPASKVERADCLKYPGTRPEWDAASGRVHCNCVNGTWSNTQARCMSKQEIAMEQADCSKHPGTRAEWDGAAQRARCNCIEGKWSDSQQRCFSQADLDALIQEDQNLLRAVQAEVDNCQFPRALQKLNSIQSTDMKAQAQGIYQAGYDHATIGHEMYERAEAQSSSGNYIEARPLYAQALAHTRCPAAKTMLSQKLAEINEKIAAHEKSEMIRKSVAEIDCSILRGSSAVWVESMQKAGCACLDGWTGYAVSGGVHECRPPVREERRPAYEPMYEPSYEPYYEPSSYQVPQPDYEQRRAHEDEMFRMLQNMQASQNAAASSGGINLDQMYANIGRSSVAQKPSGYAQPSSYSPSSGGTIPGFGTQGATPAYSGPSYSGGQGQGEFSVRPSGECPRGRYLGGCITDETPF